MREYDLTNRAIRDLAAARDWYDDRLSTSGFDFSMTYCLQFERSARDRTSTPSFKAGSVRFGVDAFRIAFTTKRWANGLWFSQCITRRVIPVSGMISIASN